LNIEQRIVNAEVPASQQAIKDNLNKQTPENAPFLFFLRNFTVS